MSSSATIAAVPSTAFVSTPVLWTARIMRGLLIAFMLFDAVTKLLRIAPVLAACGQLGLPVGLVLPIGAILLVATALYAYPRTAVLGAVLLTGFLGGAIAIQLRAGSPAFAAFSFPMLMAVLAWGPLFLTDARVRAVMPVRR